MDIDFVKTTPEDKDFFRALHHAAYQTVIESMFGWNEAEQDASADKEFSERYPRLIIYMGQKVGAIGFEDKIDHVWFGPLYISPEFQKKGIGSCVVKHFMRHAEKRNVPLRLRTLRQNFGAKALYERLGFQTTSQSHIHWHMEYIPHVP
jgi:GNAT superfamily N-acetyltransferase